MLLVLFLILSTGSVNAQQWVTANQITVSWDPVTVVSGTVSYKTYSRPVAGGVETYLRTVTTTSDTITFTIEGRYYFGVRSVRNVDGIELESSTISWSSDPAVCQGGATFGAQYYTPPANVGGLRTP
jgi:hypothetical protein